VSRRPFLPMLIATFGFSGFFPFAPGTAGSLAALVLYAPLRPYAAHPAYLGVVAAVLAAGIWAATQAERALERKDPGPVVIDEVLGMLITLAWLPLSWIGVAVGFLLFRVFDIVKPFPARRLERLHGGAGIMLDDAVAGVYAQAALQLLALAWPAWMLA
jgi:phosphatidylglycerophosphatase A